MVTGSTLCSTMDFANRKSLSPMDSQQFIQHIHRIRVFLCQVLKAIKVIDVIASRQSIGSIIVYAFNPINKEFEPIAALPPVCCHTRNKPTYWSSIYPKSMSSLPHQSFPSPQCPTCKGAIL
eukprot:209683_1